MAEARARPTAKQAKALEPTKRSAAAPAARAAAGTVKFHGGALFAGKPNQFLLVYHLGTMQKIDAIRQGVSAQVIGDLSQAMAMPKETLIASLGLSRATVNRKVANQQPLSRDESALVVGVQSLIGQVQAMVADSDEAVGFDAAKWVARWLSEPLPALGGKTPASYMDTVEGQKYISNLLAMAQSGAYA